MESKTPKECQFWIGETCLGRASGWCGGDGRKGRGGAAGARGGWRGRGGPEEVYDVGRPKREAGLGRAAGTEGTMEVASGAVAEAGTAVRRRGGAAHGNTLLAGDERMASY